MHLFPAPNFLDKDLLPMIAPWAQDEVADVSLGDKRLRNRLERILSDLGQRPNLSIPAACGGRAEMEAAYRFFDNDKVTLEKVIQPHFLKTRERIAQHERVLLINDSTELDLTRPEQQIEGVGDLDGSRRGVLLHLLHAYATDGTPLGSVAAEIVNRTDGVSLATAVQKNTKRKHTAIEDKESYRWVKALRHANDVAVHVPGVSCVYVADSEADIYEIFVEPTSPTASMDWLIRGCQDRAVLDAADKPDGCLRAKVMASPVLFEVTLQIRGRQAKTATETRSRRTTRVSRQAQVQVRAAQVMLRPPWRFDRTLVPVAVNVVLVRESNPPAGEEPIEWMLFTTLPIDTPEQVQTVVTYYCIRWQIELLFRTLKSGCRIERRRFEHVDRILPCLGVYVIVAWRTMFVCRLGRNCPDADCEMVFEPSEWKAVWVAVHQQSPPSIPPRLGEMVDLIAQLGGYVKRKGSVPGAQTVWIGMQRMYDLAWAWGSFGPEGRGQTPNQMRCVV
jgi:hypothetical protein